MKSVLKDADTLAQPSADANTQAVADFNGVTPANNRRTGLAGNFKLEDTLRHELLD